MKLTKEYDTFGMNIHLEEGNKYITFSYRGNLDLYITYHNFMKFSYFFKTSIKNFLSNLFPKVYDNTFILLSKSSLL